MYHSILQIGLCDNQKYYATYVGESFNEIIASVARSCHRLTWTDSIFKKLNALRQLDAHRLVGFRH